MNRGSTLGGEGPGDHARADTNRPQLTLALAALLLTTVGVAAVGITSLGDVNRRAQALYNDNVRTTEVTSALWSGFYAGDPPDELARVERLAEAWARFERLWQSGALDIGSAAPRRATAARVAAILEPATELAAEMAAIEAEEAHESQTRAQSTYGGASLRIVLLSAAAVLVCLLIALALVRNLVPRLRSYSNFAGRVADGQLGERLSPRGGDEVADLGRALDLMVDRRDRQRAYEKVQAEFADTMQLSEGEAGAPDGGGPAMPAARRPPGSQAPRLPGRPLRAGPPGRPGARAAAALPGLRRPVRRHHL
jgi:methyl-accepting chemotaxis protein